MTNAEGIRNMSDEDLADFLGAIAEIGAGSKKYGCDVDFSKYEKCLEWLRTEHD